MFQIFLVPKGLAQKLFLVVAIIGIAVLQVNNISQVNPDCVVFLLIAGFVGYLITPSDDCGEVHQNLFYSFIFLCFIVSIYLTVVIPYKVLTIAGLFTLQIEDIQ